ncbi:MAG: UDP-4-amino-4,6-dideoxy-N-acetyl-beta-L-altrosamine transaminase [Actinomycetota bacterium]
MSTPGLLPYGRHAIDDDDVDAVVRVLRGDWLTSGPAVDDFEQALAAETGAADAVACNSGTAALHLAAMALGLGPGDVVAVPAITFVATANAARFVGAEVVFCDVDPATALVTPATVEAAIERAGKPVKAVFPVHVAGQAVDMAALAGVCRPRGIRLVEDACHAIGTRMGDTPVGACDNSDMACFSFHPVKTVAMGEGGAVTTNDPELARHMRRVRSHGIVRQAEEFENPAQAFDGDGRPNPWYYEMVELGYNYRASDIACALGLSQLRKLPRFGQARRALAETYDRLLAPLAPKVAPLGRVPGCRPVWHIYVVRIAFAALGLDRARVMRELAARGIGSQVHYLPVHRQPYYAGRYGVETLPGADAYYQDCLTLPLFPAMTDGDVARVVEALAEVLGA